MKKNNKKKGFTIVELVIVIAVIAILAAVLIPTFSNVIAKANRTAAMEDARNEWTEYYTTIAENGTVGDYVVVYTKDKTVYLFTVENNQFDTTGFLVGTDKETAALKLKDTASSANDVTIGYAESKVTATDNGMTATVSETAVYTNGNISIYSVTYATTTSSGD